MRESGVRPDSLMLSAVALGKYEWVGGRPKRLITALGGKLTFGGLAAKVGGYKRSALSLLI